MIRFIIFDLDGVLANSKQVHFIALNRALEEKGFDPISYQDHLHRYDGLPTREKLSLYFRRWPATGGIDLGSLSRIAEAKQKYTLDMLEDVEINPEIHMILEFLNTREIPTGLEAHVGPPFYLGIKQAVVSNAVEETCEKILVKIPEWVDFTHAFPQFRVKVYSPSKDGVPKPHPHMYLQAMADFRVAPSETLIIEDAPSGLQAAYASGAHVLAVKDMYDLTLAKLQNKIASLESSRARVEVKHEEKINIVIPMAGAGSRFEAAGYGFPKPLITLSNNKPMIQVVTENLGVKAHFIYVVQYDHAQKYNLGSMLNLISPGCSVVAIPEKTDGAARTVLAAKEHFDSNVPLLIANSDQFLDWDPIGFLYKANRYDGAIATFTSTHPKWSFVSINEEGYVDRVAEKNPISSTATCGVYYWSKGWDFVTCAEQMIDKDIRTNGEFYVAPVYNELILEGGKVISYPVDKMTSLGTPEDLESALREGIV